MTNPFDNPAKDTVRKYWNTPLLQHLNSQYGFRYRYMGLPGTKLLDLVLWRDLIDEVVAFEARAKPQSGDDQGRRNINALRSNMRAYGFSGRTYFGTMEEVVILRRDQDGLPYEQSNLVTLYNLDFCDEISSPIETPGGRRQVWRFEAIRQILRDQQACYDAEQGSGYFLIFLTIRDQIDVNKLQAQFTDPLADSKRYWDLCQEARPLPPKDYILGEHSWSLKTFIHDQMRKWFANPNISALFFPVVKYNGTPVKIERRKKLPSPMLHMMVLCRFGDRTVPSPLSLPEGFLTRATSARALDDGTLAWDPEPGEPDNLDELPNSQQWFLQHRDPLITDLRTGIRKEPES